MQNEKNDFDFRSYDPQQILTLDIETTAMLHTFINGRTCPYCKSHNCVGNGNYYGRKRYYCKECKKTFNDLTNTPFEGFRDLEKVKKYMHCMIEGMSIREAARCVEISVPTSFAWRHKLLKHIEKLAAPRMKNVKEVKEVKVPFSAKGQKKPVANSLKKAKVSMVFVADRTGKLDSGSELNYNKVTNEIFNRLIITQNEDTCYVKKNQKQLRKLDCENSINKLMAQTSSLEIVNLSIKKWELWSKRFHGVATKYLNNYLHWFDFLTNSITKIDQRSCFVNLLLHRPI
jgi:transposase-like protein